MHVGIHTLRIWSEFLEVIQHRFLEIHFSDQIISSVRPSGWGGAGRKGGVTQGIYTMAFTNPPQPRTIFLYKKLPSPLPLERKTPSQKWHMHLFRHFMHQRCCWTHKEMGCWVLGLIVFFIVSLEVHHQTSFWQCYYFLSLFCKTN